MADARDPRLWLSQFIFAGICCAIMFVQLLPLDLRPAVWVAPDLLLAVAIAWVSRRPDFAPVTTIVLIFFVADLLFQRPPGLWAGLVLIMTEFLRSRNAGIRNLPLMGEWAMAAGAMIAVTLAYRLVLSIVMVPQPSLGLGLIQLVVTIICYPLVVLVAQLVFGIARPAPGEVNALGHRL